MDTYQLMKAVISDPNSIKQLLLTERQSAIVRFVWRRTAANSNDVAKKFGISINNASTSLKNISKKGYLDKVKVVSRTGGIEFVYLPSKNIL